MFRSPDLLVIGVNTTRAHRHEDGEISTAQVDRVAGLLATATQAQLRVVVVHQPIAVVRASDERNRLHGWAARASSAATTGACSVPKWGSDICSKTLMWTGWAGLA